MSQVYKKPEAESLRDRLLSVVTSSDETGIYVEAMGDGEMANPDQYGIRILTEDGKSLLIFCIDEDTRKISS